MKKIFIIIICKLFFICNIGFVHANIGDIGHWRDSVGGQIPGTTFGGFNFDSEIRNDGIYTKPNDSTIEITEAGDYLIITTTHDEDTSNGRYNSQLIISQIAGTGDVFSTHNTGFSRDNSENESWTRGVGIVIGASANSQFQVQKRRDTDTPTGGSVINSSDIQIVKLNQSNYGIYDIGGLGNVYGGTNPNTVNITNILNESDTASIEGNTTTDTITIKGDNKTYLVAWSASFDSGNTGNTRTQRIGHLEYDNVDSLSTRSYCYNRNAANEYCGLGSMDIIRTSATDIDLQTEIYRGDGVGSDQGGANKDGNLATDGNGQIIVLEMPDSLEIFNSEDSVGLQNITTPQALNIARDIKINDIGSFTKVSDTTINVTDPSDIFSWANIWTARSTISSGGRQTSYGSIIIDGVEQTTGRHGNYSRGNQGSTDTFAMGFHPAGIFTTSGSGVTIGVNSTPLPGGENGGNDRTQAGTLGFFAINLDTLTPSPGGSSKNLQIWLKADKGTSTSISGNTLNTWNDQSGNGFNATTGTAPTYFNSTADNLNFNPIVDFNGTTQYMENLDNGAYSQSYFAVVIPDSRVDGTLGGQVPFSFLCDTAFINTGTCGLPFAGLTLGSFTSAINDETITHAIGSSIGWRSAQVGSEFYQATKPMLINMNENSAGNGTEISEKGLLMDNFNTNTYQALSGTDFRIGMSMDAQYPFAYDGKIAEIINYNSRTSIDDRQKIESYLSIKYGMTLNSGTQNYTASDGSTNFWTTASAGAYINDIFGIVRDDLSELGQIKSKSVNDDNIIILEAIGEGTNTTPTFTDIGNFEALTLANNDGGNTWSAVDAPEGYFNLSRSWRIQEIGEVGTVNLDFDVANTNFDVPALSVGTNYYFTYDSNNDNSLADETPSVMVNTTGNIWQIAGIDLNHLREFTISSQSSTNNIPTNISLSNNIVNENISIGTTVGNVSTIDSDIGDSHTYTFVEGTGDDANSLFSIVGTSLLINILPDYEIQSNYSIRIQTDDGNGGQLQKAFTININDIGETINSIIDFEDIYDENKYILTSGSWTRTATTFSEGALAIESQNNGQANTQNCFEINNTFAGIGTVDFFYNVSSQAGGDFLKFYIDNIEQQAWSGTVPWTQYTDINISSGLHSYKWCYIKNGGTNTGSDKAWIDYITFQESAIDTTSPIISSINYASGTLLPGGNHNIIINYSDLDSGININSDIITLNKWNGTVWGADISAIGFGLVSKVITATVATYPTSNLTFGKYRYNFNISDNNVNSSSTGAVFYIDEPELIISTGSLDIGGLENGITKFSTGELNITVKTVGAGFDLLLNKSSALLNGSIEITDWNGINGVGFDQNPYSSTINLINTNEILNTQAGIINIDGNKNTYIYSIKLGANTEEKQAAGNYSGNIQIGINLDY